MNLGLLLSTGGSLSDYKKNGQFNRIVYYLNKYSKSFEKVYIFSYLNESASLPKNCILVPNKFRIHRYLYSLLMPFIERKYFKECNILRVTQITGATPGVISKILYKIPYVATFGFDYSSFANIEGQKLVAKLINILMPIWLNFASAIIVTNKKIQANLSFKEKLVYIPNGVDTSLFKPKTSNDPGNIVKILFAGRLVKQKNLECLIKAIDKSKHKATISITFIGEGPEREKLQSLAKNLNVRLNIFSFRPLEDLPKVYQESDIFILPSMIEGHPKVILEAMASGLPVIASGAEGITEILEDNHNGLLSKLNDEKDLSAKIDKMISDKSLVKKFVKNALETVLKNYSLSNQLDLEVKQLEKNAI